MNVDLSDDEITHLMACVMQTRNWLAGDYPDALTDEDRADDAALKGILAKLLTARQAS